MGGLYFHMTLGLVPSLLATPHFIPNLRLSTMGASAKVQYVVDP